MSLVSRSLSNALLGTTALVRVPPPVQPRNTSTGAPHTPVHSFAADPDELRDLLTRGVEAARSLVDDPRPYRFDTDALDRMAKAIEVIAELDAVDPSRIAIPAETYDMMRECIRAERARCAKRGEGWAILELVAEQAPQVMFAFSEARRRLASGQTANVGGHVFSGDAREA
jgi:hypothetical protein